MSQEKRENMEEAARHLRRAKENLGEAAEYASQGGDAGAAQRIRKMAENAGAENDAIKKKLDPKQG